MHSDSPELRIHTLRVVWRDTFTIAPGPDGPADFLPRALAALQKLPVARGHSEHKTYDQPETLQVLDRASRGVAGLGHPALRRVQFSDVRIANLKPSLDKLRRSPVTITDEEIMAASSEADWAWVTPMLLIHQARTCIMKYIACFESQPGFSPEEAIALIRMGPNTQLLGLPESWASLLPADGMRWGIPHLLPNGKGSLAVCGLRDLTRAVIQAHLAENLGLPATVKDLERPTGSTTVIIEKTSPLAPVAMDDFISQYAKELRGIGAMDSSYRERAGWLVQREMRENFSSDGEMALFALGNSELILFNEAAEEVMRSIQGRLRLSQYQNAVLYATAHYTTLIEWVYLQETLLRAYIAVMEELARRKEPQREDLIRALHGALEDLVQSQETITPYLIRAEFLERLGRAHQLERLSERFERRQDLLLNYYSEYHDWRETRAQDSLNIVVGGLAAFELASLLVTSLNLNPLSQPLPFAGIIFGSFGLISLLIVLVIRRARR